MNAYEYDLGGPKQVRLK